MFFKNKCLQRSTPHPYCIPIDERKDKNFFFFKTSRIRASGLSASAAMTPLGSTPRLIDRCTVQYHGQRVDNPTKNMISRCSIKDDWYEGMFLLLFKSANVLFMYVSTKWIVSTTVL